MTGVHPHTKVVVLMASGLLFGGFLAVDQRVAAQSTPEPAEQAPVDDAPPEPKIPARASHMVVGPAPSVCPTDGALALVGWVDGAATLGDGVDRAQIAAVPQLAVGIEDNRFVARVRTTDEPQGRAVKSNRPIRPHVQHVAVVARPGDSLRLYVDGMLAGATMIDGALLVDGATAALSDDPNAFELSCAPLGTQQITALADRAAGPVENVSVMISAL